MTAAEVPSYRLISFIAYKTMFSIINNTIINKYVGLFCTNANPSVFSLWMVNVNARYFTDQRFSANVLVTVS